MFHNMTKKKKGFENTLFELRKRGGNPPFRTNIRTLNEGFKFKLPVIFSLSSSLSCGLNRLK